MASEPGQITNPTRSGKKLAFLEALKKTLNNIYDREPTTNIHRLYYALAEQLKDLDIEEKRALADQWLKIRKSNELITRSFSTHDQLFEEGAFSLAYIGFVPENTLAFIEADLTTADTYIQLDRLPKTTSISSFSLKKGSQDFSNLLLNYDSTTNRVNITSPSQVGTYVLQFTDKGCTLTRSEIIDTTKDANGRLAVSLQANNVIYDSERVTIQNSAIGVLVRDQDYTVDYLNGTITATDTGRIQTLNAQQLDVQYNFCFNFSVKTTTSFHEQVYNEVAQVIDETTLKVSSPYVSEIFRVFNITKRQEYIPSVVSNDTISLRSVNSLEVKRRPNTSLNQLDTSFNVDRATKTLSISIPDGEGKYSIQNISNIIAKSKRIRLIEAGRQNLPTRITLRVPFETQTLILTTGGKDARKSNRTLREGTDYTLRSDTPGLFVITFPLDTSSIGSNGLYAQTVTPLSAFETKQVPSERRFQFKVKITPYSQTYAISGKNAILSDAYTYVNPGNNGDVRLKEEIIVTNSSGSIVFKENTDYTYDGVNKVVQLTSGSSIPPNSVIRVHFLGVQDITGEYLTVPDVIAIDYDKTRNAINWSPSMRTFNVRIRQSLSPDSNLIRLAYHPDNPDDLTTFEIRSATDPSTKLKAIGYDRSNRYLTVQAPTFEDDFIISYVGHTHLVSPGIQYYVSYFYGGRDRALRNVWSPLLGLDETQRRRLEEKNLIGNQTSIVLDYPPVDLNRIVIYLKGQTQNEPATTVTNFDPETNTLFFNPIRSYGTYIVAYDTENALTEDLRKFIIGMIEAFLTGPTKTGIERMVETFTDLTPDVRVATELAFKLASEIYNNDPERRSDSLNDVGFFSDNPSFVPSRFNTGFYPRVENQTTLYTPAVTNVRETEGTIQFLLGPNFNGDDDQTKYFVDIGVSEQYYKNRMTIYKNQRNYLVFETHDVKGQLWRVASDVGRKRNRFYRFLTKGTTSLELPVRPAFATTDIDNDGQFDFFDGHKTEFIIRRVNGDLLDEGYGYTTFAEYGYRGAVSTNSSITIASPVNIAIHFQIPAFPEYETQTGFDGVTKKLQALAKKVKAKGGLLVIHTSTSYLRSNSTYSNVLKDLQDKGHEIGFYIDTPKFLTAGADRLDYLIEGIELASSLGVNLISCSGNPEIKGWASLAKALDFETVIGYVDPFFGETFDDRSPSVRRVRTSETKGLLDLSAGELIYLPGVTYVDFSKPLTALTIQQIESTLHRAITMNDVNTVSSWYFTVRPEDFTSGYMAETDLISSWIESTIKPLIIQEKINWSSFNKTSELFRALEAWLTSLDAEEQNIIGKNVYVKPLKYDFDTKKITFEPLPSDGVYEFDYVSGWAAYEESEIFIAATYKFRTNDGSLPFYKLYINGELQEFVTFADFPAVGEG